MKIKNYWIVLVLLVSTCSLLFVGCANNSQPEEIVVDLNISAAASLTDVMEELKVLFDAQHDNINLTMNYGSSGALQQQIEQGAPVDVFVSAAQRQMNELEEKDLINIDSRLDLLENAVVLIAPNNTSAVDSFESLLEENVNQIGIGEPESVPAGRYAKDVLTSLEMWDAIEGKFVLGKDVRQVLTWVETGNVDAGIVYMTDALAAVVSVVSEAPYGSHDPVIYPAAIIKDTKNEQAAYTFLDFLTGEEASEVFVKHGFKTIAGE